MAVEHAYHEDPEYYEERAAGLLASACDGTPGAVSAFTAAGVPLTMDGARLVVARAHGVASWDALREYVARLRTSGAPFAAAYRAIEAHDPAALRAVLDRAPDVVGQAGTNGNDLLAMAAATCDERTVGLLLERGADPSHGNVHGWTALHQAAYVGLGPLARRLLDAGADAGRSARGDGGTPLVVALFWGHRAVTDVLLEHGGGVRPRNLRAAAGAGDVELAQTVAGTPAAGAHRAFYRPHSGFPAWSPSDDPQEVLDEALAWAARSDRVEMLESLVALGARVDADVYRGSAIGWAAFCGRAAAVRRLLELGADPDRRASFGGPDHGDGVTPLHLAAQGGHAEAVRVLLDAGADRDVVDGHGYGTPDGWAEHSGHAEVAALIRT